MKKIALSLCLLTCWAVWQAGADEENWLTDFSKAQARAKSENKLVLMDFSGSDWCTGCQALSKNVLSTKTFADFAKDNLVLVNVDFPHQKKQPKELKKANEELYDRFKVEGFPTVIVLSSDGKQLKKMDGYEGQSVQDFVGELKKLKSAS